MVCEVEKPIVEVGESTDEVINHLIFHKSLIDEERSGERIDQYISMINNMDDDGYQISSDPFECAIASVFKLVIDEKMDPWDIDLISFTKMYLEEAKDQENINFLVAGQLVNMAWSILKLQCEEVLDSAEQDQQQEEEMMEDTFFSDWDVYDYDMYEEPEDIDFQEEVVESDSQPLEKAIRREEKNPVSLIQLVDAFEEAKKEAKYREKMEKIRKEKKEEREQEMRDREENYDTRSHKEDLYHDIGMVWDRICCYEQNVITFNMIHDGRIGDIVTAMVSVLFLHKQKKIKVKQIEYPDGQILVENLVPEEERKRGIKFMAEDIEEKMPIENMATI